jgi:hypothetical protein
VSTGWSHRWDSSTTPIYIFDTPLR